MIYELHELRHSSLLPFRLWASANIAWHGSPFNPFSHSQASRAIVAGADLFLRATHRYPKPEFGLTETWAFGSKVAVTQETVLEKPFCKLLHFRRDIDVRQPTVLVVAPLFGALRHAPARHGPRSHPGP